MGNYLKKISYSLVENEQYAWLIIVLLSLVPLFNGLAVCLVVLITLRKGYFAGFKALLIGMLSWLGIFSINHPTFLAFFAVVITFLPSYMTACVLRYTVSWSKTLLFLIAIAGLALLLIKGLAPGVIVKQYQLFTTLMQQLDKSNNVKFLPLVQKYWTSKELAYYFLGTQVLSQVLLTIFYVMIARLIQSNLFYPGEFKKELLMIEAHPLAILILLTTLLGKYYDYPLADSYYLTVASYFVGASISLLADFFIKKNCRWALPIIVLPLMFFPFKLSVICIAIGTLDSVYRFRSFSSVKKIK